MMSSVSNFSPVSRHDPVSFDSANKRNSDENSASLQHDVASRSPFTSLCVRSVTCIGKTLLGVVVVPIMAVVEMLSFAFICAAVCGFGSIKWAFKKSKLCGGISLTVMPIVSVSVGLVMGTLGFCMGIIDGMRMVHSLSTDPANKTLKMMEGNIRAVLTTFAGI